MTLHEWRLQGKPPSSRVTRGPLVILGFILAMKLTKRIHRHKHAKVSDMLLLSLSIFADEDLMVKNRRFFLCGGVFGGDLFSGVFGIEGFFRKVRVSIHSENQW